MYTYVSLCKPSLCLVVHASIYCFQYLARAIVTLLLAVECCICYSVRADLRSPLVPSRPD